MRTFKISRIRQEHAHYLRWAQKGTLAVIDQGIFSGSNFVVSVLLARWMSESDYGAFAYGFSLFLFISGFYNVLLLEPLSIFGSTKHAEHFDTYLSRLVVLHIIGGIVVGVSLCLAATVYWLVHTDSRLAPVYLGLGVGHGASLLLWMVRRSYYVEQRIELALSNTIIYAVILIAGIVTLTNMNLISPFVAFFWMGISALIASCSMLIVSRNESHSVSRDISLREVAQENWRYGRWLTISALFFWLSGSAYYVLTGALLALSDVATLKSLQNLSTPVTQGITAINLLFLPWASHRYVQEGTHTLRRNTILLMIVSTGLIVVFFAILIVFKDWLFELLYAGKYAEGQRFLLQIGLISVLVAVKSAWSMSLKIREKTALVSFVDVLGSVFTVTIGIGLVSRYGLGGAVSGLVVSGITSLITLLVIELYLYRGDTKLRFLSR